jgi:adenosylhomocysteine nucleosidase
MILKYNPSVIINIGVAGGIEPSLKIGDIVVADKVCEHDMDTTAVGDEPGFITGIDMVYMHCDSEISNIISECAKDMGLHTVRGTIATGDIFVAENSVRNRISQLFNGVAAEMEGGSIGHVCVMNDVPFAILRAMSDCANDDSKVDFPVFAAKAAENSIKIILRFLNTYKG